MSECFLKPCWPHTRPIMRLSGLLMLITCLSGCFGWMPKEEPIQEPPFIPAPEAVAPKPVQTEIPVAYVGAYADLMEMSDRGQHHPDLTEAVAHAIRIGVLKPAGIEERFNPDAPIRFAEFRQWALAYQSAAAGVAEMKPAPLKESKMQPRELTTVVNRPDSLDSPMNPAKLMILPEDMRWGSHGVDSSRPLTREELCALYVTLVRKAETAQALTMDAIEAAAPGKDGLNADEALSQFKDYQTIDEWAKPYVAVAYRDGVLQKAFRLNANRLTIEEGFHPTAPVTREAAILLLHSLFAYVKSPAPVVKGGAMMTFPAKGPSVGEPGMKSGYRPQLQPLSRSEPADSAMGMQPMRNLKTLHESGPNGSRSAMRMERAE